MASTLHRDVPPLRAAREARGLSQRQLARLAGVDQGQLSRIESGREGISVQTLSRLAKALGHKELAKLLEPYRRERQ